MKTLILTLTATAALAAAAPALAQPYGGPRFAPPSPDDRLEMRIDHSLRMGAISPREAYRLRSALAEARRMEWRYQRDGFVSPWEARDLERRYAHIRLQLRHERHDREYGHGYGRGGWR